jgi:hypothetical protein
MMEEESMDEGDEDADARGPRGGAFVVPLQARVIGLPGGMGMGGGESGPSRSGSIKEDWVQFFDSVLNVQSGVKGEHEVTPQAKRRIVVLQRVEAMAGTFDTWWPSFVEALRRYRKGTSIPLTNHGRAKKAELATDSRLSQPITVIFNTSPSLLLPHTAPVVSTKKDENGEDSAHDGIHPMLQAIADRFGGVVETKVEDGDATPLWWGSEELDVVGREQREQKRLNAILDDEKG